jgi:ribosomal protein L21
MLVTRENLNEMNVENLRKYASSVGVKKIRSFKKTELIEEIIKVCSEDATDDVEVFGTDEEIAALKTECEKESESDTIDEFEETAVINEAEQANKHLEYIENAEVGTIVAFRVGDKVKSAKIINRSSARKKLKLETAYGRIYVVDYDDIIWVKTSSRWPRGVYELFSKVKNSKG